MKTRRNSTALVLFLFILVLLPGCGKADISAYQDRKIYVTGLGDPFYITPGELSQLKCTSATAVGETEKAGTVHAYGPTLDTFLEQYGYTVDDLKSIRFLAGDEYVVTLGRVTWEQHQVIFSIANGSEPLAEIQQPMKVVIPGGKSGNWIRNVIEIQFTLK